jgi:hypothetical protein
MRQTAHSSEESWGNPGLPAMQRMRAGSKRCPFAALHILKLPIYSWAE